MPSCQHNMQPYLLACVCNSTRMSQHVTTSKHNWKSAQVVNSNLLYDPKAGIGVIAGKTV